MKDGPMKRYTLFLGYGFEGSNKIPNTVCVLWRDVRSILIIFLLYSIFSNKNNIHRKLIPLFIYSMSQFITYNCRAKAMKYWGLRCTYRHQVVVLRAWVRTLDSSSYIGFHNDK